MRKTDAMPGEEFLLFLVEDLQNRTWASVCRVLLQHGCDWCSLVSLSYLEQDKLEHDLQQRTLSSSLNTAMVTTAVPYIFAATNTAEHQILPLSIPFAITIVMYVSVSLSVRSHWMVFHEILYLWLFFLKSLEKIQVVLNPKSIARTWHDYRSTFMIKSGWILIRTRNVSDKICRLYINYQLDALIITYS